MNLVTSKAIGMVNVMQLLNEAVRIHNERGVDLSFNGYNADILRTGLQFALQHVSNILEVHRMFVALQSGEVVKCTLRRNQENMRIELAWHDNNGCNVVRMTNLEAHDLMQCMPT